METAERVLHDRASQVRIQARATLANLRPGKVIPHLQSALNHGEIKEQQHALTLLGQIDSPAANELLAAWVNKLGDGSVPRAIQLDVIEAAKAKSGDFLPAIQRYQASRHREGLAQYTECLEGGDAARGEAIFSARTDVSCRRCHHTQEGFKSVGPNVFGIGAEKQRDYLLESIVYPNKQISKGFETAVIITDDGLTKTGTVSSETDELIQLMTAEGDVVSIRKDEIDHRTTGQSAMPADLVKHLSKQDLRDLVEYLASLKGEEE